MALVSLRPYSNQPYPKKDQSKYYQSKYYQSRYHQSKYQCFSPALSAALLSGAVPVALLFPAPAQAVSFRFDFNNEVSKEFQQAARAAGEAWSSNLKDDVVVDLRIEFTDLSVLGGDILGGAQPGKLSVSYEDFIEATVKDVVSSNDYLSLDSFQLPASDRAKIQNNLSRPGRRNFKTSARDFSFLLDSSFASDSFVDQSRDSYSIQDAYGISYYYDDDDDFHYHQNHGNHSYYKNHYYQNDDDDDDDYSYISRYNPEWNRNQNTTSNGFIDNNDSNNNKNVILTRAQAKALDLIRPSTRGLDAVIKINNQVSWDFDQTDGIDSDRYDLASVLQHEIGHALGIVSGVDSLDFLAQSNQRSDQSANDVEDNRFSYLTPMDFYRYSDESADLGVMDLTFGGEKYFSLDGGKTAVRDAFGRPVYFSTGSLASGGDGYQGSHWKQNYSTPFGIMNPSLQKGRSNSISDVDLTLLDTIGWDLQDSTANRAKEIGVDWWGIQRYIERERTNTLQDAIANWEGSVPELKAAMDDISIEIDLDLARRIQSGFEIIDERLSYESNDRTRIIQQFYQEVISETRARNQRLSAIPQEILTVDSQVREWLNFSTSELADRMRGASPLEINRLSTIVKAAPDEERNLYEPKLKAAIAQFADRPSQLVQELLDTSGPSNPIAYGFRKDWWFYFNLGGEETQQVNDSGMVYYSDMAYLRAAATEAAAEVANKTANKATTNSQITPLSGATLSLSTFKTTHQSQVPKDIPEPSAVLALFGIATLSAGTVRRRQRESTSA